MKTSASTRVTVVTSEYGFEVPAIEVTGRGFSAYTAILRLAARVYELADEGKADLRLWAVCPNLDHLRVELEPCASAKTADGLRILKAALCTK